jgi:putative nucleic acid binding protein
LLFRHGRLKVAADGFRPFGEEIMAFKKLGVASLTALVAVTAFIVFSPKNEFSRRDASAPDASTSLPALNEQGVKLVTNLLLEDMQTSVRGGAAQLKPEEMLRLTGIDLEATAMQYDADYAANEIAADQKYEGKKILLTGVIASTRILRATPTLSSRPATHLWGSTLS